MGSMLTQTLDQRVSKMCIANHALSAHAVQLKAFEHCKCWWTFSEQTLWFSLSNNKQPWNVRKTARHPLPNLNGMHCPSMFRCTFRMYSGHPAMDVQRMSFKHFRMSKKHPPVDVVTTMHQNNCVNWMQKRKIEKMYIESIICMLRPQRELWWKGHQNTARLLIKINAGGHLAHHCKLCKCKQILNDAAFCTSSDNPWGGD